MAKNYDNIVITTSSSDTYNTFEKSYSFVGFYRTIISGDTLDTTDRGIVKEGGHDFEDIKTEAFNIAADDIEYARIRNPHTVYGLGVVLYNTQTGTEIYLEVKPGEVLQFHSQLRTSNASVSVSDIDYIVIRATINTSAADIFIGFKEA